MPQCQHRPCWWSHNFSSTRRSVGFWRCCGSDAMRGPGMRSAGHTLAFHTCQASKGAERDKRCLGAENIFCREALASLVGFLWLATFVCSVSGGSGGSAPVMHTPLFDIETPCLPDRDRERPGAVGGDWLSSPLWVCDCAGARDSCERRRS